MYLKLPERFQRSTVFRLTCWYAFIFILSWLILFAVGFSLINDSIKSKDQQIITGMLEKYVVIEKNQGIDHLLADLKREQLAHITGGYFAMVKTPAQEILYLSLPYEWRAVELDYIKDKLTFPENGWVSLATDNYLPLDGDIARDDELEILGRRLSDGTILQVGYSAESREEFLEHFRDIFFLIVGPVILLSIVIGAFLARRFLQPVRDLTEVVERVHSGRLDMRVPLKDTDNELRVLAGQFNNMLDRIERLINSMREALDNVAHDLRTPLMRMRAAIESGVVVDDPARQREALLDCAEESERISGMLTTLMDISEAESGVMQLNYSEIRLAELIDEVRELYLYSAEEKDIAFKMQVPNELTLWADRARIRQALCNLMDNAIKYTPENGQVIVKAEKNDATVKIILQDNGIGISSDDIPRIFDRLYRGDKSRSQKGLGLGLSLVKAVIKAHQGVVEVTSTIGKGSRFCISIPSVKQHLLPNQSK